MLQVFIRNCCHARMLSSCYRLRLAEVEEVVVVEVSALFVVGLLPPSVQFGCLLFENGSA